MREGRKGTVSEQEWEQEWEQVQAQEQEQKQEREPSREGMIFVLWPLFSIRFEVIGQQEVLFSKLFLS